MFHMRFCAGRGKKRTLQRPCRISPNLRKISYDILRAQCPIAYAGVGVGQGEYVSALDWTWSKLPGPERAQVSCALQISNPQRIPRLGWTLRAWCSLGGREEGPMDRPTLGDVSSESWNASGCGEILFLPYGTFLQSDPVRSWVY